MEADVRVVNDLGNPISKSPASSGQSCEPLWFTLQNPDEVWEVVSLDLGERRDYSERTGWKLKGSGGREAERMQLMCVGAKAVRGGLS